MLWQEPVFWIVLIAFTAISTLASGIYPAFVMSNYNSVKVLKGNFSRSVAGIELNRTYFDAFYKQERQFRGVFGFFSVIGIVITCMGLFGLSIYNTTSRTKEIGIRKSLGGSALNIM